MGEGVSAIAQDVVGAHDPGVPHSPALTAAEYALFAQVARNWLLLHAVGVDASVFDAIAVLIAVVSLGQLPFGLSVGAAAS